MNRLSFSSGTRHEVARNVAMLTNKGSTKTLSASKRQVGVGKSSVQLQFCFLQSLAAAVIRKGNGTCEQPRRLFADIAPIEVPAFGKGFRDAHYVLSGRAIK